MSTIATEIEYCIQIKFSGCKLPCKLNNRYCRIYFPVLQADSVQAVELCLSTRSHHDGIIADGPATIPLPL